MNKISSGKITILVVLGILIVGLLWGMGGYNSLVNLDENAKTAQADIEVQYQRRFDLIPNLVATAGNLADREQDTFKALAEARTRYSGAPAGSPERIGAIQNLDGALARLLVVVENYPSFKSSENYLKLQDQLEGTENRVQVSRNTYNAVVNDLNKKIRSFPSNFLAKIFGFDARDRFESEQEAAKAPKVDFSK